MTGPDLKPCPFCGEKMPAHDDTSYIRCMGCGAESGWRATPEDVTAAWNRRDPAVLAALPEVQAMIAAAYEVAATCTEWTAWGQRHNLTEASRRAIRALTPADATAAISARDAAMIAQGMREAAEVAFGVTPYKRVRGEAGYSDLMCARSDGTWQNRKETQAAILARAAGIEGDAK